MLRLFLAAILAVLAGALGGCDFTPTLDVPLPDFEPALTINGVLAADSTVEVRVTLARDPYVIPPPDPDGRFNRPDVFYAPDGASAELLRDGASLGALRLDPRPCRDVFDEAPVLEARCGAFVSDVVTEAGATYTVRASAPGVPPAEATVTVPARVPASATGSPSRQIGPRTDTDLEVTFRDPQGAGQRYTLMVVSGPYSYESPTYCDGCGDSTVTRHSNRVPIGYTTSDPVLLAGARTIPSSGVDFITFTDEAFDGTARTFPLRAQQFNYERAGEVAPIAAVRVVSIDDRTFGAYQIAWFGGGNDNPFAEPADLPSNVVGGYGLLGAVAITEALIE